MMDIFEEISKDWKRDGDIAPNPLTAEYAEHIIKGRINREKKRMMEYFWGSFFYQNLIYGFGAYFLVTYRGIPEIAWPIALVMIVYIPFTIFLLKRYKSIVSPTVKEAGYPYNALAHVSTMQAQLQSFYSLKWKFDWISVPLSCAAIVLITFRLFVGGDLTEHVPAVVMLFLLWLTLFTAAIHFENQKRFAGPLSQLKSILHDLKTDD